MYIYSTLSSQPFNIDDLNFFESKFIELFKSYENEKCEILNKNNGNETVYKSDSLYIYEKTYLFNSIIALIEQLNKDYFLDLQPDSNSLDNSIEKNKYLIDEDNLSPDIIKIYPKNNKNLSFKFNKKNSSVFFPKGTLVNTKIYEKTGIPSLKNLLKELKKKKIIDDGKFIEDIWIKKPSPAAAIISGNSTDGWYYWMTEDNQPINIFRS